MSFKMGGVYLRDKKYMFFLVDAFTKSSFLGNPAGVCLLEGDYPDARIMQDLAAYFNWSEISFIKKIGENRYRLRWFTPLDEAPLCGHATLGASHIIFQNMWNTDNSNTIEFVYNDGILKSTLNSDMSITMSFPVKPIERCCDIPFSIENIIGIREYEAVYKDDLIYMIVLKRASDIFNARPNFEEIKKIKIRAILITAPGFDEYDFCSRYFAPSVGLYEDPVCGSAHCRLSYYWRDILHKNEFLAFQASKRTGVLKLRISENNVYITAFSKTVCHFDFDINDFIHNSKIRLGIS